MTKADLVFLSGILAISLLALFLFPLFYTKGGYAEISYNGTVLVQVPLTAKEEKCYLIASNPALSPDYGQDGAKEAQPVLVELQKEDAGTWEMAAEEQAALQQANDYNIFLCQDGKVRMLVSNCPDQICVRHNAVSATGENIICLPHKMMIEIIGSKEQALDGVAY